MKAIVARPFFVERGGHIYETGDTFDGPRAQVARLAARGLVEPAPQQAPKTRQAGEEAGQGIAELTNRQLMAMLDERGVDYPRKANKAQLVSLLSEGR